MIKLSQKPLNFDNMNKEDFDELIGAYHEAFSNLLNDFRANTQYCADEEVTIINKARKEYEAK